MSVLKLFDSAVCIQMLELEPRYHLPKHAERLLDSGRWSVAVEYQYKSHRFSLIAPDVGEAHLIEWSTHGMRPCVAHCTGEEVVPLARAIVGESLYRPAKGASVCTQAARDQFPAATARATPWPDWDAGGDLGPRATDVFGDPAFWSELRVAWKGDGLPHATLQLQVVLVRHGYYQMARQLRVLRVAALRLLPPLSACPLPVAAA